MKPSDVLHSAISLQLRRVWGVVQECSCLSGYKTRYETFSCVLFSLLPDSTINMINWFKSDVSLRTHVLPPLINPPNTANQIKTQYLAKEESRITLRVPLAIDSGGSVPVPTTPPVDSATALEMVTMNATIGCGDQEDQPYSTS